MSTRESSADSDNLIARHGDKADGVMDWSPWDPFPNDCPFRNISAESLQACSLLADKIPSQSPQAKYIQRQTYTEVIVGTEVFKRPRGEPIFDFLIAHLNLTFGEEWARPQYALPIEQRHVVMRWWFSVCESQKLSAPADHREGEWFEVVPTGDAMEFMTLADDLYRLRLANALRPKLVNRLRHHEEFQGARYECAIAASFVRCGFDIAWQSGPDVKCEFVATQKLTGEAIAIEVKSRRRPGTLNQDGTMPNLTSLRLDASHLYKKALTQCPNDTPCGIFIDVNLPWYSPGELTEIPWWEEIKAMMNEHPEPTVEIPALETCLVFTNFNWHYSGKNKARGHPYVYAFPEFVRRRLTNLNTFVAILRAIQRYSEIPGSSER